jgi:hypothetical protein
LLATSIVSLLFSQFLADVQHKHQTQEADPNGSFTRQPAFLNLNPFKESGIQQTCCCATYGRVSDLGRQMMLCTTVLYCTVLYCTVLYCTVLYCTVLYCTVLYCTVLYCTVSNLLYCTVLCRTYCLSRQNWAHHHLKWLVYLSRYIRYNVWGIVTLAKQQICRAGKAVLVLHASNNAGLGVLQASKKSKLYDSSQRRQYVMQSTNYALQRKTVQ